MTHPKQAKQRAVGDHVEPRTLTTMRGQEVALPQADRLIHLQFRRFAGCPICNTHLRGISARLDEITAADIREIVVFHSTKEALLEYEDHLPFDVVADPEQLLYDEFGVTASPKALLSPRAWAAGARGMMRSDRRSKKVRGAVGMGEAHSGLPADLLVGPDGTVLAAKYGAHAADQWSVDELLAHAAQS